MRNLLALALPLALAACKGGDLSEEDSQAAFASMNTVSADVQTQAYASLSTAAKALTVEGSDGSYTFSGALDSGTGWTGTVNVDGAATYASPNYSFDFAMEYVDVESGGLILNGDLDWAMEYGSDAATGAFNYAYSMVGAMDVTGDAEGAIDFDYTLIMEVDPQTGAYTYEASGDINGYDVSGWTTGGAGSYGY